MVISPEGFKVIDMYSQNLSCRFFLNAKGDSISFFYNKIRTLIRRGQLVLNKGWWIIPQNPVPNIDGPLTCFSVIKTLLSSGCFPQMFPCPFTI